MKPLNKPAYPRHFDLKNSVLVFAFNFYPQRGGIQTYSYELCRNLHKLGYVPIILARATPGDMEFDAKAPFTIIRMKWMNFRYLRIIPMTFYFLFAVLRHRIRLVHCINWIPCGFIARILKPILFYKYVITCHGAEITMARGIMKNLLLNTTIKNSSWLIAGNNYIRNILQQFNLPNTPVSVIGFGVDTEVFRPDLDAEFLKVKYSTRRKKVLITVAELKKRKGIDKVMQAISLLGDRGKDILYIVVGDGPDRERLMEIANNLKLSDRVVFTGTVSDRDLPYHYAIADIYIMPNREEANGDIEGFGITFIEAQAAEKPVIGGLSGGVPDSVYDRKTGILVDPLNEKQIASSISELLENSDEALTMAKNGRERVSALFSWPTITSKTEMIYTKVFEKAKRR